MSKSYNNNIPLFEAESTLKRMIRRIPTDSTPVEAPKDPDSSSIFQILQQFASPDVTADVRARLKAGGYGWGDLKNQLFDVLNAELLHLCARNTASSWSREVSLTHSLQRVPRRPDSARAACSSQCEVP